MKIPAQWILPDWPAPAHVRCFITSRDGGVSKEPRASFNIGEKCGDDPAAVRENLRRLRELLPDDPAWLTQVHGARVVEADPLQGPLEADGSVTRRSNTVCAIKVADCMPILLTDRAGMVVGACHAGWRGLCTGVVENTARRMGVASSDLLAYLGPAIGPNAFEVGEDVRSRFTAHSPQADQAFVPHGPGKWLANLYTLARQRLESIGVRDIYGGTLCTWSDRERFFSFRRDRVTGRMAALIWIQPVDAS